MGLLEVKSLQQHRLKKMGSIKDYLANWEKFKLKDGVLYRTSDIKGETVEQLVLLASMRETIFSAYHDDLGHQGRDRTISLIKQRFYWPGMNSYIGNHVTFCGRYIRRKTASLKATELVNIASTAPMELVCIDYLTLERSKGGYENILVITDHFSRFAQAIPTRNQTAHTTARVLFENYFVHYGFPAELHSDKGANFESKTIKKLCRPSRKMAELGANILAILNGQCYYDNEGGEVEAENLSNYVVSRRICCRSRIRNIISIVDSYPKWQNLERIFWLYSTVSVIMTMKVEKWKRKTLATIYTDTARFLENLLLSIYR